MQNCSNVCAYGFTIQGSAWKEASILWRYVGLAVAYTVCSAKSWLLGVLAEKNKCGFCVPAWNHGCRSNVRALRCLTSERFATCNGSIMGVWFVLHCLCMLEGPFCCFPADTLFHCRIISTFAVFHPLLSDFFLLPFWKKAIGIWQFFSLGAYC